MAKCDICGKGVTFGIKVSHSHRRSNRTWKPNVRRVKAIVNGTPCHIHACTRCLRSGKAAQSRTRTYGRQCPEDDAQTFIRAFRAIQKDIRPH